MFPQQLKENYEKACNDFINLFARKQDIEFDGWAGDEVGGIAAFAESYFFSMSDIIADVVGVQEKGFILKWQNETTEFLIKNSGGAIINYKSYIMGLRYGDLKNFGNY